MEVIHITVGDSLDSFITKKPFPPEIPKNPPQKKATPIYFFLQLISNQDETYFEPEVQRNLGAFQARHVTSSTLGGLVALQPS